MALRELLEENELDGVDFNWEFPQKPDEWQKWGLLMQEAKVLSLVLSLEPLHS